TISFDTPRIRCPSNFVSRTTTSSGTRKMRLMVSEFGRFMRPVPHDIIGGCDESDYARGGQGYAPPSAHHPHAETDRPDLRGPVSPAPAQHHEEGPRLRGAAP